MHCLTTSSDYYWPPVRNALWDDLSKRIMHESIALSLSLAHAQSHLHSDYIGSINRPFSHNTVLKTIDTVMKVAIKGTAERIIGRSLHRSQVNLLSLLYRCNWRRENNRSFTAPSTSESPQPIVLVQLTQEGNDLGWSRRQATTGITSTRLSYITDIIHKSPEGNKLLFVDNDTL